MGRTKLGRATKTQPKPGVAKRANIARKQRQEEKEHDASQGKAPTAVHAKIDGMLLFVNKAGLRCRLWQRFRRVLVMPPEARAAVVAAITKPGSGDAQMAAEVFEAVKYWLRCMRSVNNSWSSPGGKFVRSQAPEILLRWARALLHPDLPYELRISPSKGAGLFMKKGTRPLPFEGLRALGLQGFVEVLDEKTFKYAEDIGYPSLVNTGGCKGLLWGPMAMLSAADEGSPSTFTLSNATPTDGDGGGSASSELPEDEAPAQLEQPQRQEQLQQQERQEQQEQLVARRSISTRSRGPCEDQAELEAAMAAAQKDHTARRRAAVPCRGQGPMQRPCKEVQLNDNATPTSEGELTLYYGTGYERGACMLKEMKRDLSE